MKNRIIAMLTALTLALSAAPVWADHDLVEARGTFTASIDIATFTLVPIGANCLLEVDGALHFIGTLEGLASGNTRALVLADCADVAVNPPGTFADVFRSNLEFIGTIDGEPTIADITYRGKTAVGGDITAVMILSNGAKGVLHVDAIVAVGGTYEGIVLLDDDFDDRD